MASKAGEGDAYYRAMLARDYRFDGKFFVGVRTTGVYCRPICPARPRRENVEFFPTAQAAEGAGYRPCLRCRPEAAPESPAWLGKTALVQRALKALAEPGVLGNGEEAFAARFGVGARHLRRLFEEEIGKSPIRLHQERRLDFARKLIVETRLPMADIAFGAGFASIRRFNQAVHDRFRRAPTALRRQGGKGATAGSGADGGAASGPAGLVLKLPFRPPFEWEASLAYYRSHGLHGLESFRDGAYERVFRFPGAGGKPGSAGISRVTLGKGPAHLDLEIRGGDIPSLAKVVRAARRMFDLDSDPLLVANGFSACPALDRLRRRHPGLRSPRGWDPWETAVSAILGQLVSIAQANRMIAALMAGHGEEIAHPVTGDPLRLFPSPAVLAEASLAAVGTTESRKTLLRDFARRVADGRLSLDGAQDPRAFRDALLSIRGIGPWTAEYISLRALGDADAFPSTDLVLKRALENRPRLDPDLVKPWRGYAAAHLWHAHGQAARSVSSAATAPATPSPSARSRARKAA
jgi:AraC family transcriptional regulator of adaptative response / DNA-3-methyladenine glycosylase II